MKFSAIFTVEKYNIEEYYPPEHILIGENPDINKMINFDYDVYELVERRDDFKQLDDGVYHAYLTATATFLEYMSENVERYTLVDIEYINYRRLGD